MKVAGQTDENEKICAGLLPVSLAVERSDEEALEEVNCYDAVLEDGYEEGDTIVKTHVYHATPDVEKSDDEQLEDTNYYDSDLEDGGEESDIPGGTHVGCAAPGGWCRRCQPVRYRVQVALMNQALKLAEWEDDKEQKALNPDPLVLRRNETAGVSNQLEISQASSSSKWLRRVGIEEMLLIELCKWKTAITAGMHSVECAVLLPFPHWSGGRAGAAGGVPNTRWGIDRCGLLPYLGDLLMQTILQWTMDLLAMNCLMKNNVW